MSKKIQIILGVIVVAVVIFFVISQLTTPSAPTTNAGLRELQESIIKDPVINAPNLTQERIDTYLVQLKNAQAQVKSVNYNTLQGLNTIAQLKRQLGDFQGAIDAWEYANKIRPQNSLSFSNLAALYHYDLLDYVKAEKYYRISVDNDPDDIFIIRNFYELYHYSLEDNQAAEELLQEFIGLNPETADLYSLAGRFYTEINEIEKAIEYYESHLELNPDNTSARNEVERLKELL